MAFNKALAERLGIGEMMSGAQASSMGLMAMFKGGWEEALDEMSELQGFPVKTVMQMEMGGENCTAASGQQIAMDDTPRCVAYQYASLGAGRTHVLQTTGPRNPPQDHHVLASEPLKPPAFTPGAGQLQLCHGPLPAVRP